MSGSGMDDLMDDVGTTTTTTVRVPAAGGPALEQRVPETVADLLRAPDGARMVATLRDLVASCGGEVDTAGLEPLAALRALPDAIRVSNGREMTLSPVLRALSAAAVERASGDLAPTRRLHSTAGGSGIGAGTTLVALDLGSIGAVRLEFGDPGARWLVEKLRRTLRSLLREQDTALRYPAMRFLVVLGGAGPTDGHRFARRLAWEWDAYLGRRLRVGTQVEPIEDGDLAAALRRLAFGPRVS